MLLFWGFNLHLLDYWLCTFSCTFSHLLVWVYFCLLYKLVFFSNFFNYLFGFLSFYFLIPEFLLLKCSTPWIDYLIFSLLFFIFLSFFSSSVFSQLYFPFKIFTYDTFSFFPNYFSMVSICMSFLHHPNVSCLILKSRYGKHSTSVLVSMVIIKCFSSPCMKKHGLFPLACFLFLCSSWGRFFLDVKWSLANGSYLNSFGTQKLTSSSESLREACQV